MNEKKPVSCDPRCIHVSAAANVNWVGAVPIYCRVVGISEKGIIVHVPTLKTNPHAPDISYLSLVQCKRPIAKRVNGRG